MTSELEMNMVSVERVKEYADMEREALPVMPHNRPPQDWPAHGSVQFEKLCLRYRPGLPLVLKDLTASFNPAEKIGIVGRTGAGKSSIVTAVLRLVEPEAGRVLVDGIDLSSIGLQDLRSNLVVIAQDPTLFTGTVRFNLDPFGKHTDHEIWESLRRAHMASIFASLDDDVSEGGGNLSVGQRQLLSISRALLRKKKLIFIMKLQLQWMWKRMHCCSGA